MARGSSLWLPAVWGPAILSGASVEPKRPLGPSARTACAGQDHSPPPAHGTLGRCGRPAYPSASPLIATSIASTFCCIFFFTSPWMMAPISGTMYS